YEAIISHFPDDDSLVAYSALIVLRTAVEVLVERSDGGIYSDALQVGESCLQRVSANGNAALAAELTFRLGRLHFEPIAPDPAYGFLELCLADRHDQQIQLDEGVPAGQQIDPRYFQSGNSGDVPESQLKRLPERRALLALAVDRFVEAIRLADQDRRSIFAGY